MREDLRHSNRLLAALPEDEWDLLRPHAGEMRLDHGRILNQAGDPVQSIYFPTSGAISALSVTTEGGSVEALIAGSEGVMGVAAALDLPISPWRLTVQAAGEAITILPEAMAEVLPALPRAQYLLFRYVHALQTLATQSIACNRFHELPERTARWLLMLRDRVEGDELLITQEFLAQMLGVHRPSTTIALATLKEAGLIRPSGRGRIQILDRPGLEAASCECYRIVTLAFHEVVD